VSKPKQKERPAAKLCDWCKVNFVEYVDDDLCGWCTEKAKER